MSSPAQRFTELYERFYDDVYGYAYRRTSSHDAHDVAANTFLTAWRRIEDVPDGEAALPWLYGVAYRCVGSHWRTTSRRQRLHDRLAALRRTIPPSPEDHAIHTEEGKLVVAASRRLRPVDREILHLSEWEQLSHQEIGRVLEITPEAAKQRLYRARRSLRRAHHALLIRPLGSA